MIQKTNESILIIGTVKNCADRLRKNIIKLLSLKKYFKTVEFLLYENNSTDTTKNILHTLAQEHTCFHYISKDLTEQEIAVLCKSKHISGTPCRIEIISYARNVLVSEIKKKYSSFSYILNLDFDVFCFNPADIYRTILRAKKEKLNFDCISANGLTKWLRYRDAYAFRNKTYPFGPEFLGQPWWTVTRKQIQQRYKGGQFLPVYSAFGGAALYKTQVYISSNYSALPTDNFIYMHKQHIGSCCGHNIPSIPITYGKYDMPVICEHVPFHYGLARAGYDKQYIDTSWRVFFLD